MATVALFCSGIQLLAAALPPVRQKRRTFTSMHLQCAPQGNFFDKYGGASNLAELNALLKNTVGGNMNAVGWKGALVTSGLHMQSLKAPLWCAPPQIMVRRLKRDVLQQLPSKRRQQVILALDADAKKHLAGLQKQARCHGLQAPTAGGCLPALVLTAAPPACKTAAGGGAADHGGGGAQERGLGGRCRVSLAVLSWRSNALGQCWVPVRLIAQSVS